MVKFPYVLEYSLFTQVEIKNAEELLAEYNDFYIYNLAQYQSLFEHDNEKFVVEELELAERERLDAVAEHNVKVSTDHFSKLFGSKDFAESSLVGLKINWYDLQQILLEEYKTKVPIHQSSMNDIAPRLRTVATILLFAERVVTKLEKLECDRDVTEPVKKGFEDLLERAGAGDFCLPEFHKAKVQLNKMKRVNLITEFCKKLFESGPLHTPGQET